MERRVGLRALQRSVGTSVAESRQTASGLRSRRPDRIGIAIAESRGTGRELGSLDDKMKNFLDIDVALGGYYASKGESGKRYSAFRLLDFTSDAYHAALFSERFDQMPTMQELGRLAPYIGHAPIDVRSLLKEREIRLVGTLPLTRDDLEGYRIYLEHHDVAESEISELMTNLMASSTEPPIRLRLEAVNDEISISERE